MRNVDKVDKVEVRSPAQEADRARWLRAVREHGMCDPGAWEWEAEDQSLVMK